MMKSLLAHLPTRLHDGAVVGVVLAVCSNVLFGVLYVYGKWLTVSGTQLFLWRMVMMWVCLTAFLVMSAKFTKVMVDLRAIWELKAWGWLLLPTPIFASQLWLFMWSPINGQGMAVAMGYFLFPLVMVMVGFFMGEKLSRLQWLAVACAGVGVSVEMVRTGQVSWATFWVCLTYPVYYVMRRWQGVPPLTGLWVDVSLIAPVCLAVMVFDGTWQAVVRHDENLFKVALLGVISVCALLANLEANRRLSTSLFGLLGYLEPALLFLLSIVVLGEIFSLGMLISFGLIWVGILCLLVQGLMQKKLP